MIGSSIVPTDKVRFTVGITLAESYDDYKLKDFDNMRLFGRLSIAL